MTKYKIEVTEVLKRTIEMEADNEATAIEMVKRMYHNCDFVLDSSDYIETEFDVKRWKSKWKRNNCRDKYVSLQCLLLWIFERRQNIVELDSSI